MTATLIHPSPEKATQRVLISSKRKGFGSTTLNREDLKQGAEPDSCFYIQNTVEFFQLQNGEYSLSQYSNTFPIVPSEIINQFLQMAETEDDMTILDAFRVWVRNQLRSPENQQE